MRLKLIFFLILCSKLCSDPYQAFLNYVRNINNAKAKLIFQQVQYGKEYSTSGSIYIFSSGFYCYDDLEKRIIVSGDSILTFSKLNKQLIYDDKIAGDFSVFDILSGNTENIEIDSIKSGNNKNLIYISIPDLNLFGTLSTGFHSGRPIKILLKNESSYLVNIEVGEMIVFKRKNLPTIDLANYEIIDLRE
tara:strand:+ start:3762 stop:4334 length:573 start_codon:yes stop_codon:yes gene_type:complete